MRLFTADTEDRTRTYDLHHVKVLLYQLSYPRIEHWAGMDSNHRKQTLADLQSAPFDRSGTYPFWCGTFTLAGFSSGSHRPLCTACGRTLP